MMNVVVSSNSKYVRYLYIMLLSLFESTSAESIQVYVLERDFTVKDRELLKDLSVSYGSKIMFLDVDEKRFYNLPTSEKFPLEAYFRLLLVELLPEEIDKALYLDVDIIVRGDLSELYAINIDEFIAAVCYDMYRPILDKKKKDMFRRNEDLSYFNSGVMLLNVNKFKKEFSFDSFMDAARELGYDLQFADQEILNYILYDKVKYLPAEKYNYLVLGDAKEEDLFDDTIILHYAGCNPWQEGPKNDLHRIWWRYAKKTPFYTDLLEEQLWRAEGLVSDGNAIGMREMEIKGIYEVAFSIKGDGLIKKWLQHHNKRICIYGAGAMAEVLYELLMA